MDAVGWAAVSAIASAVSAAITLVIARANASETRTASQTADFANCLAVVSALADAQRRVFDADHDQRRRDFEFHELLNLMEALARLHNDNKLTDSTRKLIEDFLDEAWAHLNVEPATRSLIAESITGPETYKELVTFSKRHGSRCQRLIELYQETKDNMARKRRE